MLQKCKIESWEKFAEDLEKRMEKYNTKKNCRGNSMNSRLCGQSVRRDGCCN